MSLIVPVTKKGTKEMVTIAHILILLMVRLTEIIYYMCLKYSKNVFAEAFQDPFSMDSPS